jgi:hypothetical protein
LRDIGGCARSSWDSDQTVMDREIKKHIRANATAQQYMHGRDELPLIFIMDDSHSNSQQTIDHISSLRSTGARAMMPFGWVSGPCYSIALDLPNAMLYVLATQVTSDASMAAKTFIDNSDIQDDEPPHSGTVPVNISLDTNNIKKALSSSNWKAKVLELLLQAEMVQHLASSGFTHASVFDAFVKHCDKTSDEEERYDLVLEAFERKERFVHNGMKERSFAFAVRIAGGALCALLVATDNMSARDLLRLMVQHMKLSNVDFSGKLDAWRNKLKASFPDQYPGDAQPALTLSIMGNMVTQKMIIRIRRGVYSTQHQLPK